MRTKEAQPQLNADFNRRWPRSVAAEVTKLKPASMPNQSSERVGDRVGGGEPQIFPAARECSIGGLVNQLLRFTRDGFDQKNHGNGKAL